MNSVSYIEELCKENDLHNLPALTQLKKAKDEEDIKRISDNIINFIKMKAKQFQIE